MEPYASVGDLACTVIDEAVAGKLIERASLMVRSLCGGDPSDPDVARLVVCQMVERALSSPAPDEYGGADQGIQSISSYSNTWTWGNPVGDLFVKSSERRMLGAGGAIGVARPSYGRLEPDDG